MLSTISTLAHTIWLWLPTITVGLQTVDALLRFRWTITCAVQHPRADDTATHKNCAAASGGSVGRRPRGCPLADQLARNVAAKTRTLIQHLYDRTCAYRLRVWSGNSPASL